jgi:hypothetical protein
VIDHEARYQDGKHAREIRLLLTANITTYDTMYGVLGEYDSARCKALRRAASVLQFAAQYGHVTRKSTKKRGAK